ncbi:tetraspanin-19 isoform X1 [Acanthopagrus latus]|uniref:tetraspanin-19 isoform X1 n=1 Tax=Acanthopagrus latus TaxID=8177 RepID=UPI00187C2C5D|nr:tetraspanin-19 isoform X1 [Acanthopagrus latus]
MKLELKIQLLQFISHVFNSVFLVLGLSVAGCAVWILFDRGTLLTFVSSDELRTVGAGLLLIGGVVVLVSLIGCAGASGQNRLLLLVYLGLLIVLVLGQLFVTLLLLINRDKIGQSLNDTVDDIISLYGQSGHRKDQLMDDIQTHGRCCGRMGPSDWLKNSYIDSLNLTGPDVLPCSCFRTVQRSFNSSWCSDLPTLPDPQYGRGNGSYQQGCGKELSDWLQENALTIVGMDVGLILIQLLQFGVMVILYRAFSRKAALKRTRSLVDTDHAHLDHAPEDDYAEQNYGFVNNDDGLVDSTHPPYHHDNQNNR